MREINEKQISRLLLHTTYLHST